MDVYGNKFRLSNFYYFSSDRISVFKECIVYNLNCIFSILNYDQRTVNCLTGLTFRNSFNKNTQIMIESYYREIKIITYKWPLLKIQNPVLLFLFNIYGFILVTLRRV